MQDVVQNAADILEEGAATYRQRNAQYGNSYKEFGHILKALFPKGVPNLPDVADNNRLMVFLQIVGKVHRYANNFTRGGHEDSLIDISVYSAMLAELDRDEDARRKQQAKELADAAIKSGKKKQRSKKK